MKTRNVLVALAIAVSLTFFATTVRAEVVGWWQFNEHVSGTQTTGTAGELLDSSGNGHHGRGYATTAEYLPYYSDGSPNDTATGGINSSLELGSNTVRKDKDSAVVPGSTAFDLMLGDLTDYTIEADIKITGGNYYQVIFAKWDGTTTGYTFRTNGPIDGRVPLQLWIKEATALTQNSVVATGSIGVMNGEWHHVKVLIDANENPALTNVEFYVDGVKDTGTTVSVGDNYTGSNLVISGDQFIGRLDASGTELTGSIDNVKFCSFAVPEPSTLALLSAVLIGLLAYAWRKGK